ncbi:MAG: DNA repair protein RecO [Myxococcota bacterium]
MSDGPSSSTALGVVTGGTDYGESDRVVHLLTRFGRLSCFAPSARKSRRRFGAGLEPFTTIRVELARRRRASGLPGLTQVEVLRSRWGLSQDLERLALAAYGCELSDRVAVEGVETHLPDRLELLLEHLLEAPATRAARRAFELRVLEELGLRPEMGACPSCGRPGAYLDLTRGGTFCVEHRGMGREIGPRTAEWIQDVLSDDALFPAGRLSAEDAERASRAISRSLDAAVAEVVGGKLASRKLLDASGL